MSPVLFRRKKIRADMTLGARFQAARTRLGLSLDEAERATRVRAKYLAAFEEGRFHELPPDVYTLGFIRRYAELLGLDPRKVCTEYRGERFTAEKLRPNEHTPAVKAPRLAPASILAEPRFIITPKLFWLTASLVFVLAVASYVWYQVQGFIAAPELNVAVPAPEMVVSSPSITIEGQTDGHAILTINSEPIAIDPEGNFEQEVYLASGMNTIEISARNRLNKETRKQIRVLATY